MLSTCLHIAILRLEANDSNISIINQPHILGARQHLQYTFMTLDTETSSQYDIRILQLRACRADVNITARLIH